MRIKKYIYDFSVCIGLLAITAGLVVFPSESVEAASSGVSLCLNVIVPSLFPFFVISSLMVNLGIAGRIGRFSSPLMRPLFGIGGAASAALVLGLVGGYPVGARTAVSLYENGSISKAEAERLLGFCNNSGPAFILGVVGAGVFADSRIGLLLLITHIAASLITGLIFRAGGDISSGSASHSFAPRVPLPSAFVESVRSSFTSTLNICGFVIFFTVVIKLLGISGAIPRSADIIGSVFSGIGFDASASERLLTGFFELCSGVWTLKDADNLYSAVAMAAFMLGWAGLSVHCQALSFLHGSGLRIKNYIIGKLLHGTLASVLTLLFAGLFINGSKAVYYADIQSFSELPAVFPISLGFSSALLALFVILCSLSSKNTGKKDSKSI